MISGDEATCEEARRLMPSIVTASVKRGLGAYAAACLHPRRAQELVYESAKKAISGLKQLKPLPVSQPVVMKVRFTTASVVDRCLRLKGVEPLDGVTMNRLPKRWPKPSCFSMSWLTYRS